jgi:hypothetical protein
VITKELLHAKLADLEQSQRQDIANANAKGGAIMVLKEMIASWDAPAEMIGPVGPVPGQTEG